MVLQGITYVTEQKELFPCIGYLVVFMFVQPLMQQNKMKAKKVSISEDVKISESGYNDGDFEEEGKIEMQDCHFNGHLN